MKSGEIERWPKLHPTGLHSESLAGRVLDFMNQNRLGLLGLAAAADVMAAECRFNHWILTGVKRQNLPEKSWLQLLDNVEANNDRCRSAIAAFAAGGSDEQLCSELACVAAFLNERALPSEES
jgi:hypothetical protein